MSCAAALEVQRIIREENLVARVKESGALLGRLLHEYLDDHPYVGNVRGKGLFWAVGCSSGQTFRDNVTNIMTG